ncbi:MAG: 2'-5' RNA ligase family protein [Sphingosinicella sp.]|nr:2'-5' RNA ligase family protein [Sphingosinicella sp.]
MVIAIFCILPPAAVARQVGLLRDGLDCGGTLVADGRLHVTLGITNDYPAHDPQLTDQLLTIGGSIEAEQGHVSFDRLSGSGATIALTPSKAAHGLADLHREIARAMAMKNVLRDGWHCNPHITLAYYDRHPFIKPSPQFSWDAKELVLIHSFLGKTKHVVLGRWPLVRRQLDLLG